MNESRQIRRTQIQNKIERLQVELEYLDKLDELEARQAQESDQDTNQNDKRSN